jgi:predicted molibdopterin-dependent oxidoreductase YjgC
VVDEPEAAVEAPPLPKEVTEDASANLALYVWDGEIASSAVPPRDAYALRLVAGRVLYDAGSIVSESPSLAPLAPGSTLSISRADRDRIGVDDGAQVRVTTARGSLILPVRVDPGTPAGVAFLPFNQAGPGAADLIDVTDAVTDLRVESIR